MKKYKPFKTEYPPEIKTRFAKIGYWLFKQDYIFGQGRHLLGKVTSIGVDIMAILYLLDRFGISPEGFELVFWVGLAMVMAYLVGMWIYKHRVDKLEATVSYERIPILKDIHNNTGKREEL